MRHFRATFGIAAVVCMFAVMATPALAKQFTTSRLPHACSEAEPCKTRGHGIGEPEEKHPEYTQKFVIGAFTILCKKATSYAKTPAEGAFIGASSPILATEIKFGECVTLARFGTFVAAVKTNFNAGQPVKFVYHANGFAELGTGETETAVEVGEIATSFKIQGKVCTINLPTQTVPAKAAIVPEGEYSAATYSNEAVPAPETQLKKFPSGFQQKLVIANVFKGLKYEYESGQCKGEGGFEEEAPKPEGATGKYTGSLEEEVLAGNLGFQP